MTRTELESINIPVGWLCPLCGTIYSPGTDSCKACTVVEDKYDEVPPEATYEVMPDEPATNPPHDS